MYASQSSLALSNSSTFLTKAIVALLHFSFFAPSSVCYARYSCNPFAGCDCPLNSHTTPDDHFKIYYVWQSVCVCVCVCVHVHAHTHLCVNVLVCMCVCVCVYVCVGSDRPLDGLQLPAYLSPCVCVCVCVCVHVPGRRLAEKTALPQVGVSSHHTTHYSPTESSNISQCLNWSGLVWPDLVQLGPVWHGSDCV